MTKTSFLTTALAIFLLAHLPSSVYTQGPANNGGGGGIPVNFVNTSSLCDECKFIHGVGYNSHPTDCTLFIQCMLGSNGRPVVAAVKTCPHGQYWNQEKLTCELSQNVNCTDDICLGFPKTKRSQASCRGYWDCKTRPSTAKCCPKGTVYDPETERCVYQPSCQDDCLDHTAVTGSTECRDGMSGYNGSHHYWVRVPVKGWIYMRCGAGTAFSTNPCGCTIHDPTNRKVCRSEVYLPFYRDHKDFYGRVHVRNEGVTIRNGRAYFNGENSRLIINRFSNTHWGSTIYISVIFKSFQGQKHRPRLALFSNGDCGETHTMSMCAGPEGVDFYAKTQNSTAPASFTVEYSAFDPRHSRKYAVYRLDSGYLRGFVNYVSGYEETRGDLVSTHCGLIIGSGGGCENFYGYIDSVRIYLCRPSFL